MRFIFLCILYYFPAEALLTASFIASLVTVAPVTPSTSVESASAINAGYCSIAFEPMPCVSLSPTASTFVMFSPFNVTVTVTFPLNPLAVPVNILVSPAAAGSSPFLLIKAMSNDSNHALLMRLKKFYPSTFY